MLTQLCEELGGFPYPVEIKLDIKAVESVLKKCRNITTVRLELEDKVSEAVSLIGRYCPHLKSLSFQNFDRNSLQFFRQYGHKLEELIFYRKRS